MRFVMIVGDSRRRNFELSGLKVRPGARAAGVGWAGAALVVCRARAGDRRGHCARLSNREKLGMDQVFVVWTSKSGLNQPTVV